MNERPDLLIFGGTTEGRRAAAVCDGGSRSFFYSTQSAGQEVPAARAVRLCGAMDAERMTAFCRENGVRLIVDAAHPFAEALHRNIAEVSHNQYIPVIRYERRYPDRDPRFHWFDTYEEAMRYLEEKKIDNLLALSGVNTIPALKPYWSRRVCRFRVLRRAESLTAARAAGFPEDRLLFYDPEADETETIRALSPAPGAILTKESGGSGGFDAKARAALALGIPLLVIRRPATDRSFVPVWGDHGLRREIERLLPDFFELRTGLTTGTCATAATAAALHALLSGKETARVEVTLPDGEPIEVPVERVTIGPDSTVAEVIKDAGDDPDATSGATIRSTVRLNGTPGLVRFLPGEGVGTVTLPGLGLEVGGPAVNAVPRRMMTDAVLSLLACRGATGGVDVAISVPGGAEIAARTFNPKLGIVGGLSILGTSGIVRPFSAEAFLASIGREMDVARALGCDHLILNSGARSERMIRARFPDARPQAFVHYGNAIGEAIRLADEAGFERVTLGIMIGKAVKLAEGALDTHSGRAAMNHAFLQRLAAEAGCSPPTVERIAGITLARELREVVPPDEQPPFFAAVVEKCRETCAPLFHGGAGLEIVLVEDPA